ncbi:MAG: GAF domain-containing protein [Nitrolancea sp.]
MDEHAANQGDEALTRAQSTIEEQRAEIDRLRRRLGEEQLADELRRVFTLAATTGIVAAPVAPTNLLRIIVQVAADVISARAGSLFLIDRDQQDLVFAVAIGPKAEEVEQFRVPLGHGVAGIVALTGQAMAVSDVQSDPRHASDISQSVGYLPQSLLCVPLFYGDEIIGVLELLDKEGDASSFGPTDIDHLGLFAGLAAVAIEQSRAHQNLGTLLGELLTPTDDGRGIQPDVAERVRGMIQSLEGDDAYRETLEIAHLIEEIAHQGESERAAVRAILRGFYEYLRAQREPASLLGLFQ